MDESRKQFEEWFKWYTGVGVEKTDSVNLIEMYWQAWKASRTAIEVKLPAIVDSLNDKWTGYNLGLRDSVKCIRAAGIKVTE